MKNFRRGTSVLAAAAVVALTLAGCGAGNDGGSEGEALIVGTTDKVVSIDPAGSYDNGSLNVQTQVYQYLLNFKEGSTELSPDAAESCDFTKANEYTCTLKEGLKFANGNELTSSDVVHSFNRVIKINDPSGPASLLGGMEKVEAPDDKTVVFTLKSENDQTFPQILVTSAGPIVDEDTYPADKKIDDEAAVKANGFSGPYTIGQYDKNQLAEFKANPDYDGTYGKPTEEAVTMKYYAKAENLKLDIENGDIDVAFRSLTPTDIEDLDGADGVNVNTGAGGELRYIVFNLKTMPGDNEEQKLAIRKAMASSVDRQALSTEVYKETFTPAYSMVPQGQEGATEPFKELYGETPDKAAAEKFLSDAGVDTPVNIKLQYNPDHYGSNSDQEYNAIKRQLDETGLFEVELQSTEWTTYQEESRADAYPVYQLGWFPDFPDADNYLAPFLGKENVLRLPYANDEVRNTLLPESRREADRVNATEILTGIQDIVADDVPVLPLWQGNQYVAARDDVTGSEYALNSSSTLQLWELGRGMSG
jgi:peptide/nickel transport system substrate-binding protein